MSLGEVCESKFNLIFLSHRVFVGIKKLLDLIDMAKYTDPQNRVNKFITKLEDEGCLEAQ